MPARTGQDSLVTALSHIAEAGLVLVNPDATVEFATARAVELLSCGDLGSLEDCPGDLRSRLEDCLRRAKDQASRNLSDDPMERLEIQVNDPECRDVLLEVFPVDLETCEGMMVVVRDETERRQIVRDLLDATRMRNLMRLYRAASHELRTPVASISIYLHLLRSAIRKQQAPVETPDAQQQLEVIASELGNLDSSMQLLLDEMTPSEGADRPYVLRDVALQTSRLIDIQARQYAQSLTVTLADGGLRVHGRPMRLRHALLNIAFYRLDQLGDGGKLELAMGFDNGTATVTIRDQGPRIDDLDRLFTRRHATDDDGTAIGLYVAWEVVRDAGGQLTCASDDSETRFTIRLPEAKG